MKRSIVIIILCFQLLVNYEETAQALELVPPNVMISLQNRMKITTAAKLNADADSVLNDTGQCTDDTPCQLCEGDCNVDENCAIGLSCFIRDAGTPSEGVPVPGCVTNPISLFGKNFCINATLYPCQDQFEDDGLCNWVSLNTGGRTNTEGRNDTEARCDIYGQFCRETCGYCRPRQITPFLNFTGQCSTYDTPCQLCEGDCDEDENCAEGLSCFIRDSRTPSQVIPIPGCATNGTSPESMFFAKDFCYNATLDPCEDDASSDFCGWVTETSQRCLLYSHLCRESCGHCRPRAPSTAPSLSSTPSTAPSLSSIPSTMSPSVAPSPNPNPFFAFPNPACFSGVTTAIVKEKGHVLMSDIAVGDLVLTGKGNYAIVFSIDHRHPTKKTNFLQIFVHPHHYLQNKDEEIKKTAAAINYHNNASLSPASPLELTRKHMVFVEGRQHPIPANTLKTGDRIQTIYGPRTIINIKPIIRNGLYNPLTSHGTIVVNEGIIASTYSALPHDSNDEWFINNNEFINNDNDDDATRQQRQQQHRITAAVDHWYYRISGTGSMMISHQYFFNSILKPYEFVCTHISLELCTIKKQGTIITNEKVAISELASRLYECYHWLVHHAHQYNNYDTDSNVDNYFINACIICTNNKVAVAMILGLLVRATVRMLVRHKSSLDLAWQVSLHPKK